MHNPTCLLLSEVNEIKVVGLVSTNLFSIAIKDPLSNFFKCVNKLPLVKFKAFHSIENVVCLLESKNDSKSDSRDSSGPIKLTRKKST